jgi:hypothetical protein
VLSAEAWTTTRTLSVEIGVEKLKRRLARVLPVTVPPGTVTQAAPFHVCTSNEVMP